MYKSTRILQLQTLNRPNVIAHLFLKRCTSSKSSPLQNVKTLSLYPKTTVKDLASKVRRKEAVLLELLNEYGYKLDSGIDTVLDKDIAEAIADEYGYTVVAQKNIVKETTDNFLLSQRPPVITIMGHVDHGKTTLLDYLRNTRVAENEAGGITQSIASFSVKVPGMKDKITFVDTPGHAAFNNMRARGAEITDAIVLIIAADDGIMKQTIECIEHIKKANVPLTVAFNKIDKATTNIEKIKKDLLTHGIQLKEFGGDVESVAISALKGTNVDELLILLNHLSEENEFLAAYDAPAEIVVLESKNDKQKGIISTVLVKQGQLSKGKVLLADSGFAKIRQMFDSYGNVVNSANPADPVQILGWKTMPQPGDVATEVPNEAEARKILKLREQNKKPVKVASKPMTKAPGKKGVTQEFKSGRSKRLPYRVSLRAEAANHVVEEKIKPKVIDVILKVDVSGSMEALVNVLNNFHSADITLNIIHAAVGPVNESDLKMLQSSEDGLLYSFNADIDKTVSLKAEELDIPVKRFDIIYKLLDDLKEVLEDKLPLIREEVVIGQADVLKVFHMTGTKKGVVAGCRVKDGFLDQTDKTFVWKVLRGDDTIHEGGIQSLKRGHEDISLAKKMTECGIVLENFTAFEEGDQIICLRVDKLKQTVDWKL